ncbi:MAG: ABC transporter permease [Clostridia bacterium]
MIIYNTLMTILQQGLCYGLVAMGVYVSYKILDFPDLTVDGSFPLGGVVAVTLINGGMNFVLAIFIAMIAGAIMGMVTGILHVKFKISNLLSGILTMTALASINLAFAGRKIFVPYQNNHIFNNSFMSLFGANSEFGVIAILLLIVVAFKILIDIFLKTKTGFMLRAVGSNEKFCASMGRDSGNYKIMGLGAANGMVALGGAVYSQMMNFYDNTSGVGMVVLALASVIIGCAVFRKLPKVKGTTAVLVGALIYTACLNVIVVTLSIFNIGSEYLKLVMAILFAVILVLNNTLLSKGKKTVFSKEA